jgi:putative ABC transport system permease protein
MLKQKTKEISIRKVLGASLCQLVMLLSRSFIKIFIITCVVGLPLAILVNQFIMQAFAYRVDLVIGYAIGLLLIFFIAMVTIGTQILRAATVNPVHGLRSE